LPIISLVDLRTSFDLDIHGNAIDSDYRSRRAALRRWRILAAADCHRGRASPAGHARTRHRRRNIDRIFWTAAVAPHRELNRSDPQGRANRALKGRPASTSCGRLATRQARSRGGEARGNCFAPSLMTVPPTEAALHVFDENAFVVRATGTFEGPVIESRLTRVNPRKVHLRGAFWAPRAIVHVRACRRVFELRHVRFQTG